ncbi:MAG: S41 family peptidase [Desulfomonilaceae bacterium]|nr:S41 family peptidase [Desulfomonilaceae bacterium]
MSIMRHARFTALTLVLVGFALLAGPFLGNCVWAKSPDYKQLRLFRDVMGIVQKNYVKDVSDKELIQGAINGMLQSLDPHSSFLTEDLFKELQDETKGEFGGLGIEITLDNGVLTIVSPIEDTPADKIGLKPGDKIVKIDGESTKNITLLQAVKKMRGPKGTTVTITIMREGFRKFKDITITRDIIHVKSIKKQPLEAGFPYVKIVNFQESTDTDLKAAIEQESREQPIKGMILDLRNNPGGLLDQAVKVANLFIDKGLIVYTDGRVKDQRMEFRATTSGKHYDFKTAVLINGGSASASEIVAGALQDNDRAAIFGTKSFGKASVQTIIPLDNGSGLRLTTAYYYTPKGRHIQEKGIQPDVDMKKEVEKQEEQEELEEEKKNKDDKKEKKSRLRPESKEDLKKDPVVRAALEWLTSDKSVTEFKEEQKKKTVVPETAFHDAAEN